MTVINMIVVEVKPLGYNILKALKNLEVYLGRITHLYKAVSQS